MSSSKQVFIDSINAAYDYKGDSLLMGGVKLEEEILEGLHVKIPLKALNRHGLIAGATGTVPRHRRRPRDGVDGRRRGRCPRGAGAPPTTTKPQVRDLGLACRSRVRGGT